MLKNIALIASIILPLWNIPLIYGMIKRGSSKDISLYWAFGVWICLLLMFPAALTSVDIVWKTFSITNMVLFSAVTVTAVILQKPGKTAIKVINSDFTKLICQRTSIRKFKPIEIKRDVLEQLVDAGRRAPSARAVEPWEFVVVQSKESLLKLGQIAINGSFIKDAQAAIIVFCAKTRYYLEDGCAATENILLAAADQGLGACWIAGDKKEYAQQVCELFKVNDALVLVSIIALGIADEHKIQVKKRPLEAVIHWEFFNKRSI
jgi:nitroreductase